MGLIFSHPVVFILHKYYVIISLWRLKFLKNNEEKYLMYKLTMLYFVYLRNIVIPFCKCL